MVRKREGYHDMFATIPEPLWHALCEEAATNERSATSQLVWILKQRFPDAVQQIEDAAASETAKGTKRKRGK